ncbi:hypothetical protein EDC01DRAFT_294997 [Geopyxis carbonaria]|nr:hypothetical protein EDC01DRAFT_294997 [Geopyxis carbonaria]
MAFNFNWSPLNTSSATSSAFYTHARSLLTAALNKSSKPPIIVDDIFVEELNLGESAPDLEILEIGDIAEDRFRGIFRMNYAGDAFLTLRTKVQANPLNTYLSTTPTYTSPDPLSASSPLTIPVQITLSSFKLSGFVILVFSKAKGITLVFRNDPLESLKVSSTFDSIPFIAEYLQKEIERQVRRIFQEDLPVAVHRLSLRLWNPEYAASLGMETTAPSRPTSPEDKIQHDDDEDELDDDLAGSFNPLISSTDNTEEAFSQQNIQHLSSLVESQKTLSLVTPKLQDVVFRAWASGSSHHARTIWDRPGALDILMPQDVPSGSGCATPYTHSEGDDPSADTRSIAGSTISARPSLYSTNSSMSVSSATAGRVTPGRRKKKHRVVNLRKPQDKPAPPQPTVEEEDTSAMDLSEFMEKPPMMGRLREDSIDYESRPSSPSDSVATADITYPPPPRKASPTPAAPVKLSPMPSAETEKQALRDRESKPTPPIVEDPRIRLSSGGAPGSILEQAFVKKVVGELRQRLKEERERSYTGEKMWGVERELQDLEGDQGLPAYGA